LILTGNYRANRRIILPEASPTADVVLKTLQSVAEGFVVWSKVIEGHPSGIAVRGNREHHHGDREEKGGDLQVAYEKIRV
jgi:hypothetical protein